MAKSFLVPKNCDFKGVYAIMNTRNKKCYVGSSGNIQARFSQHMSQLKANKSPVKEMQEDFNNGDCFVFHVVLRHYDRYEQEHKNKEELLGLELETMERLDSVNNGYNINDRIVWTPTRRDIWESKGYLRELAEFFEGITDEKPFIDLWTNYREKLELK